MKEVFYPYIFDNMENSNNPTDFTYNIMVFGRPCSGKSRFINLSMGEKVSRENSSTLSVTKKCVEYCLPINNTKDFTNKPKGSIKLIDTPGINSKTYKDLFSIIQKYVDYYEDCKDIINCAIYFSKTGDEITSEDFEIIKYFDKKNKITICFNPFQKNK